MLSFKENEEEDVPSRRDTNEIHNFKVHFEDVVAEPPGMYSLKCSWTVNRLFFKLSKSIIYIALTMIVAPIVVFCWGIVYGFFMFFIIWIIYPFVHLFKIVTEPCAKFVRYIANTTLTPLFESCGSYWSRMKLQHHYVTGPPRKDEPYIV